MANRGPRQKRRRIVSRKHNVVTPLLPIVSKRYAVDILDTLAERPHTYAELRTSLRAHRHDLDTAIRTLAAQGAIQRPTHPGSWDRRAPAHAQYELTTTGHELAHQLSQMNVWTAIYEYFLYAPPLDQDPDD